MDIFKFGSSEYATPVGILIKSGTDPLLLQPDWAKNLEICDAVSRTKEGPEHAMKAILKRMKETDQNTVYLSMVIAETCMKNCGLYFAICVHQKPFLDELIAIARSPKIGTRNNEQALKLIQQWGRMFEKNHRDSFPLFFDTFLSLKSKGIKFPPDEDNVNLTVVDDNSNTAPSVRRSSLKIDSSRTTVTDVSLNSINNSGVSTFQSNLSNAKETKTASNSDKLQQDLNALAERNTMCQEILLVSPGISKDDLLRESIGFLEACRDRMVDLINAGAQGTLSEDMFALVLKINDEVMKTLYAEKTGDFSGLSIKTDSKEDSGTSNNLLDLSPKQQHYGAHIKADVDPLLDPFIPSVGPSKPPRNNNSISEPVVPAAADSKHISSSSASASINPFNYDPFGDDFDTKPIDTNSSSSSTIPLPPPHEAADIFPVMQTLPPAPALDEFSLLMSTNQAPSGSTANANGSNSSISASDSDLDSFFDSLNRTMK